MWRRPAPTSEFWLWRMLTACWIILERLKGARRFTHINSRFDYLGKLTAFSVLGYELSVYCKRRVYRRSYETWWSWKSHSVVFEVYSIATNDAPPNLIKACLENRTFPKLLPWFVYDDLQARAAVDAYLEQLTELFGGYNETRKETKS